MSNKTEQIEINAMPSTPSSHWRAEGATDPHAGHYDGERAALAMGKLTDDELANGAFMNYDQPLNLAGIIAGTHSSPIAWMTAVKDRIRWLSRSLERVAAERDALAAELKALRGDQTPAADDINLQNWKGMDGVIAFFLIDRHGDNWNHVARLMNAWLEANREDLVAQLATAMRDAGEFAHQSMKAQDELKALREQSPVAWNVVSEGRKHGLHRLEKDARSHVKRLQCHPFSAIAIAPTAMPLYAHPARELTDETIQRHWDEACKDTPQTPGWSRHIRFARAIERYLKGESE